MALAEATVRVTLDVAHFERELREKVKQAANRAGRDFDKEMKAQLAASGRNASTAFREAARTGMVRAGRDAARDFDLTFQQGLSQTGGKVAQRLGQGLQVQVGRAGVDAGRRFATNLANTLGSAGGQVGSALLTAITARLSNGGTKLATGLTKGLQPAAVAAAGSAGRSAARSFNLSFGVGTAGVGRPVLAAFALIGSAMIEAIRPALSIVSTLPGLFFAVTSAALITAAATKGIGDAFKAVASGDLDKITESMAALSPAAQSFVREFSAFRPQIRALRREIQDAFFNQLSGQVTDLATAFTGRLRPSVVSVADAMGNVSRSFLEVLTSARGIEDLRAIFRGTSDFLNQLAPGLGKLTQGLLDFSAASAPGLNSIGRAFRDLLTDAGTFLTRAADSGQALAWVEGGIIGVRNLAAAIGDIIDAFGVLFAAVRPLTFALAQIADFITDLIGLFGQLPGPLQTAAIAALLFARSGLPETFARMNAQANPLITTMTQMGRSYGTAFAAVQQFNAGASILGRTLGTVRNGFGAAADAALRMASVTRGAVLGTASAVETALTRSTSFLQGAYIRAGIEATSAASTIGSAFSRTSLFLQGAFIRAGIEAADAGNTMQRALTRTATAADTAGQSLRGGLLAATERVVGAATAAGRALQTGLVNSVAAIPAASQAASRAMQTGLIRASIETENAFNRVSRVVDNARDTLRAGLVPTTFAIERGMIRAGIAAENFGDTLRYGLARAVAGAETAATGLATTVRTGLTTATIAAGGAARSFGQSMSTGVLRPLYDAGVAYRTASTSVRDFATAQTALTTPLGQTATLASRVRDGFTNLVAATQGSGAAIRSLASGPLTAAGEGLRNLGSIAAGTGAALTKGIGSAVGGLVNAFGGPWGLAIAGAGIALSLLASSQDKARQAAAQHAADVSKLTDTLDRQTGAVTAATLAQATQQFSQNAAGDSARRLGINLKLVSEAAIGGADAQRELDAALRASAKGALQQQGDLELLELQAKNLGIPLDTLIDALLGNASAMKTLEGATAGTDARFSTILETGRRLIPDQAALGQAVENTSNSLGDHASRMREAAAAMTPAQVAALKYADILGVLGDKTSDVDKKARALNEALNILAGGTVSAEVAQGRFTELLGSLDERLGDTVKGLGDLNAEMLVSGGRINTSTAAGAFLVNTYEQLTSSLSSTVASTLEAGRATGDLDGAYLKIAKQTQEARAQFIQTATAMGLPATQAEALADAYGLIPAQVLTTVTDQGSAQNTEFKIAAVYAQIKNLPLNTPVRVQGLTEDAQRQLRDVGLKVEAIPGSKDVKVTATTKEAVNSLQGLINRFSGTVINFVASIFDGNAIGNIVPNATGNVLRFAHGGKHLRKMSANRADIVGPNTWRVIGDRATHDEAYIPINSSARSRSLLVETARRMGFALLADGGVLGGSRRGGGGGLNVAAGAIVINAPFADPGLVARATVNELARQVGAVGR